MKKAIIYFFAFLAIQVVAGAIVQGILTLTTRESASETATGIILITAVYSVITAVVFLWAKWSKVSRHWIRKRPWVILIWCMVAALGAIIPSVWIQEHRPVLPNFAESAFELIMKDRWGYVAIGLLAPLVEEMVFRGAILRVLLQWCSKPWVSIAISALLFAVAHMNPAQLPHAFLIGLLLGWMYYRTDSIIPGIVYHWINNSVAYVMYNLYPDPDLTLAQLFGSERTALMAVGCSLCIFLPALFQLNQRLEK